MRALKVGDKVDMDDGSKIFGIDNGEYSVYCDHRNGDRINLTVKQIGLRIVPDIDNRYENGCLAGRDVCTILVADGKGNFWFVPDDQLRLVKPEKMITINGKEWSESTIAEALRKHAK